MIYETLNVYTECIKQIQIWPWWILAHRHPDLTHKVQVLCRLMLNQNCLQSSVHHYTKDTPACKLCECNMSETPSHLIFTCSKLESLRKELWSQAMLSIPHAMLEELNKMDSDEKTVFILSGFHSPFVHEWEETYTHLANFIATLYYRRRDCEIH